MHCCHFHPDLRLPLHLLLPWWDDLVELYFSSSFLISHPARICLLFWQHTELFKTKVQKSCIVCCLLSWKFEDVSDFIAFREIIDDGIDSFALLLCDFLTNASLKISLFFSSLLINNKISHSIMLVCFLIMSICSLEKDEKGWMLFGGSTSHMSILKTSAAENFDSDGEWKAKLSL